MEPEFINGYDDSDLEYDLGEGRWSDPDWDDYDEDLVDEWLRDETPIKPPRWTWRENLIFAYSNLKRDLHPNRLRKCPVCHKRGKADWREGMCIDCWIPF